MRLYSVVLEFFLCYSTLLHVVYNQLVIYLIVLISFMFTVVVIVPQNCLWTGTDPKSSIKPVFTRVGGQKNQKPTAKVKPQMKYVAQELSTAATSRNSSVNASLRSRMNDLDDISLSDPLPLTRSTSALSANIDSATAKVSQFKIFPRFCPKMWDRLRPILVIIMLFLMSCLRIFLLGYILRELRIPASTIIHLYWPNILDLYLWLSEIIYRVLLEITLNITERVKTGFLYLGWHSKFVSSIWICGQVFIGI